MNSGKRGLLNVDLGGVTEKVLDTTESLAAEFEVKRRFEDVKRYLTSRTEKQRKFLSSLYEEIKPILSEVLVFLFTWSGPPLFLITFYLSTSLIRFSRYLSKKLDKPEEPSVRRALAIISKIWINITRYYHDHEIKGLEKIPSQSSAVLVWYHGVVPIDYLALVSQLYLRDGRMVHSVVDRFLPSVPGWELLEKDLKLTAAGKGESKERNEEVEIFSLCEGTWWTSWRTARSWAWQWAELERLSSTGTTLWTGAPGPASPRWRCSQVRSRSRDQD